jgi:hypothetical protein
MTDTARNIEHLDPASTDGLADFFEPQTSTDQLSTDQGVATPDHGLTIEHAAKVLCVSSRTVLRRLQKGTLAGFKVQGQFGLEWRVSSLTSSAQLSTSQGVATLDHGQTTYVQALTTPDQPNTELVEELRRQIADLKNELEKKVSDAQREIQAASFRNGYLESQLETQRDQIKLLTDSKHKPGWWQRFKQLWLKH